MFDPMTDIISPDLIIHALLLLGVVAVPWVLVTAGLGTAADSSFAGENNLRSDAALMARFLKSGS